MDCFGDRSSKLTLRSSFFDNLWPLILDDNICELASKEESNFFEPSTQFNQFSWHSFLADVGFPQYENPIELHCFKADELSEAAKEAANKAADEKAEERAAYCPEDNVPRIKKPVVSVASQVNSLNTEHEKRQKLAYDFANRKFPWTMQRPDYETDFDITDQLLSIFRNPFERAILRAINVYSLKLMIIDAGTDICFEDFQRWIKFRAYVQMLALVRCPVVERQLKLMDGVFHTILVEENSENSWHEELQSSLRTGFRYAREHQLPGGCGEAVFIFSEQRGICTCDTFKVVRIL